MEKLDGKSLNLVQENINKLIELFPEIANGDNQINFDSLRELLEENADIIDDSEEHYNFTWWGKKEAIRIAKESISKTLRPSLKNSKNWDTTENIYIEGDNLDALKILLGSYRDTIKMIYIDPPYNTGRDFVYKDNRSENIREHLENTNQLNEEGMLLENAKTNGKYHSNWLNMMYPRLYLSRKFLREDGVIFISIDDNEVENLKKLCNEIYGEENFVAQLNFRRLGGRQDSKYFAVVHEYILVFAKSINTFVAGEKPKEIGDFPKFDEEKNRKYKTQLLRKWGSNSRRSDRPNLFYPINAPDGSKVYPMISDTEEGRWRWSKTTMQKNIDDGNVEFIKKDNNWIAYEKIYEPLPGEEPTMKYNTWIDNINSGAGSTLIKELFDNHAVFDYPKPVELINLLQKMANVKENDIILDFFSGSATTAEGIMRFNSENNFNNSFILIQIPEETAENSEAFKEGYKNICEIGEERINRAGDKILNESVNKDLDIGFKVFKVDESNFIPWNPIINSEEDVEQSVLSTGNNIVDGCSELDLIYELLLKLNMDLSCSIEEEVINNRKVYVVDYGYALICLDEDIDESIANDLLQLKKDLMTEYCQVILRDDAFNGNDELAINIYNALNSEGIEFKTI